MKIIISLIVALFGFFFGGIVATICQEEADSTTDFDIDNDGGFLDDWRLP